jgi:hypothetical protein
VRLLQCLESWERRIDRWGLLRSGPIGRLRGIKIDGARQRRVACRCGAVP